MVKASQKLAPLILAVRWQHVADAKPTTPAAGWDAPATPASPPHQASPKLTPFARRLGLADRVEQ